MARYGQLPPPHMRGHLCSLPIDNPPPTTLPTDPNERQKRLSRQKHRNEISPLDPNLFKPDFDVIEELRTNRDAYSAWNDEDRSRITLYSWPVMCRLAINSIRAKVSKSSKPGEHPTISCCISRGLEVITSDTSVIHLIEYKERFDGVDPSKDGDIIVIVAEWFNSFKLDIEASGKKQDVTLPKSIHYPLSELSSNIGMTTSSLACMAAMITLSDQDCVNKDHKKSMVKTVKKMMGKIEVRVRGTRYLMEGFGL